MSWIDDHKGVWRVAILVLLLAAIIGLWTFDRIYVPSQYPCSAPFVRLQGDFCGMPLPGMRVFSWVVAGFIHLVVGLVTGAQDAPLRSGSAFNPTAGYKPAGSEDLSRSGRVCNPTAGCKRVESGDVQPIFRLGASL